MENRFTDRYKIKSSRFQNWNYSNPGYYFITICTYNKNNFFGKIIDEKMELSKMGEISKNCLINISKHFNNVFIDEYVIMPNHIHILIKLIKSNNYCRDVACNVSTNTNTYEISTDNLTKSKYFSNISPKPNSIPTIIRSFKSAVTCHINPKIVFFGWQTRFYDHIVKDQKEYFKIKKYIQSNIKNWNKDKYFIRS